MKKKPILLLLFIAPLFLFACTADNERENLFCRSIGFDSADGKITVTALFSTAGKDTPTGNEKRLVSYTAKNAGDAADFLAGYKNALYKPAKSLIFGKDLDKDTKNQILAVFSNRREFQLKCMVYDEKNAARAVKSDEIKSKGMPFGEYFRLSFKKGR